MVKKLVTDPNAISSNKGQIYEEAGEAEQPPKAFLEVARLYICWQLQVRKSKAHASFLLHTLCCCYAKVHQGPA